MSIEELKEKITTDELIEMVRNIISYDGSFEDLDYFENDEYFFQDFFQNKVDEAVRAVCYGNYEYMDDYVKFNAYGNLDSCSEYQYRNEVENNRDEIIEHYLELYADNNVYPSDELKQKLYDYYEEKENE
jgi:hypothetical protein